MEKFSIKKNCYFNQFTFCTAENVESKKILRKIEKILGKIKKIFENRNISRENRKKFWEK